MVASKHPAQANVLLFLGLSSLSWLYQQVYYTLVLECKAACEFVHAGNANCGAGVDPVHSAHQLSGDVRPL